MILLPAGGTLEMQTEVQRGGTWITGDRFAVLPPGHAHASRALRASHYHVALYVTAPALAGLEKTVGSLSNTRAKLARAAVYPMTDEIRFLERLCRAGDAREPMTIAARRHLATALLITCLAVIERSAPLSMASPEGHGATVAAEIAAFVREHAADALRLDDIATAFGLSRRHVTRTFREHYGVSIGAFQELKRVEFAKALLTESHLPVGEIAMRVGFADGTALARAMRRHLGNAPVEYRRTMARSAAR